ncbi:MAG: hypothetical protein L0211_19935 [Planctomycetaceae bacterium]|nr:hypothetical protein [Planctomycetaceae bacterium]
MTVVQAWVVASVLVVQTPPVTPGESPAAGAPKAALEEFLADAKTYQMTLGGSPGKNLEFSPQPLLHWGNPARNGEDGAVFVWLKQGRPEVIGSVFEYPARGVVVRKHALHSLADQPITASFNDVEIWTPKAAGVKFAAVPGAEPPADNPRRRLAQMRELARQFTVEMVDLRESKSELRLMSQPLIRYEPKAGATQDGAIFALAVGTDPEALLLLEARKSEDAARWEYAFARFHFVLLSARHDGREVWRVEADRDMMSTVFGRGDPQREKIYYSVVKAIAMP